MDLRINFYFPKYIYIFIVGWLFANDLGDRVLSIPKTQKIGLDVALLKVQYYKVRIEGKVE